MSTQKMEPGLRERKKEQTRQLIADTARRLFAERGFESVTVAEIARAADVSEKTVFNYFPTKEELFYSRLEAFEEELLAAVREREPGESSLAALLAEETGAGTDDVEPRVVASALLGVHRSLIEYVRRRVAAGAAAPRI